MKNQYLADLGDYGKYALLRFLASKGINIGVNWYLTPNDRSSDGKFTDYLEEPIKEWMHDTELFDCLKTVYKRDGKSVLDIECTNLIPGVIYFSDCLDQNNRSFFERDLNRNRWFEASVLALKKAELIFADPDNGISYRATARTKNNEKYILPQEVERYYCEGKDVVFYCHKGRRSDAAWLKVRTQLMQRLGNAQILTLTYHKGTQRSYIFALHPDSVNNYAEWIYSFVSNGWYPAFTSEGFTFRNVAEFQDMYPTKPEKEHALKDLSNAQIDLLIESCSNVQAKIFYATFKKSVKGK